MLKRLCIVVTASLVLSCTVSKPRPPASLRAPPSPQISGERLPPAGRPAPGLTASIQADRSCGYSYTEPARSPASDTTM